MVKCLGSASIFVCAVFVCVAFAQAQITDSEGYYDIGVFAFEDGDYVKALANFERALASSPNNPYYLQYLGRTYHEMKSYEKAFQAYRKAVSLMPDIPQLKYDLASLYYDMEKYEKAGDLFMEIAGADPDHVLARYYAGINLYKQERYAEALNYFLSAAEDSPSVKTNGYYYAGVCCLETGKVEKGTELLTYVRENDSGLLGDNAAVRLAAAAGRKKPVKPYQLYLKAGGRYDGNARLDPEDSGVSGDIETGKDEEDWIMFGLFYGSYDFGITPDFKIGAGYNHYQSWYDEYSEYDLTAGIFHLDAEYRFNRATFRLEYAPAFFRVDSENYLKRHGFKAGAEWRTSFGLTTGLAYTFYDNDYENGDMDGDTNEMALNGKWSVWRGKGWIVAQIACEMNSAFHPDYEYRRIKTKLGAVVELPWNTAFSIFLKYQDKKYDNTDSAYRIERNDDKYIVSASLTKRIYYEWLRAGVDLDYTDNDSNVKAYTYHSESAALFMSVLF